MEPRSSRRPTDFTPLLELAKDEGVTPKHVGIVVGPTGDRAAPFVGLLTADHHVVVRAALDRAGAASFVAEAVTRVNATLPGARVQVVVELDERTQIGAPASAPPAVPHRPPEQRAEVLVAVLERVFEAQRRHLEQYLARNLPPVQPGAGKAPRATRKRAEEKVRGKAQVRAKPPARTKRTGGTAEHAGARRARSSARSALEIAGSPLRHRR